MKTRILSGLIMTPFLVVLYFGGYVLMAACLFVGLVGLYEFFKGFKAMDIHPFYGVGVSAVGGLYSLNAYMGHSFLNDGAPAEPYTAHLPEFYLYTFWLFFVVVASVLVLLAKEWKGKQGKVEDAMATIVGIVYVVFFSFHVMLVDQTDYPLMIWVIVVGAFGTDICAYFAGVFLGKHKLCPNISPKKTVEGSVGGILGATLLCWLLGWPLPYGIHHYIILGFLCGIFSQAGDLTASIFKRKMGIKDYGNLIPGHGGILDRFDSVLFTAPLVFYYILICM